MVPLDSLEFSGAAKGSIAGGKTYQEKLPIGAIGKNFQSGKGAADLSGYRGLGASCYRAIWGYRVMRKAIGLSGYRGKSAIGVSGKLPIGAIGENFQSGYRGKLPIGMWQALSGKTPNRELTDSSIFLQRLGKWQEGG